LCSATEFILWQKKIATTKMVENSKVVLESNIIKVPTTTSPIKKVDTVEYRNEQYGFMVTLPLTWINYSIVSSTWKADKINAAGKNVLAASGPMISIRNPKWTKKNPYQDIPVLIFTLAQWSDIQSEAMHIGAAPIPPSELSRNAKYVFALPARYNFAFPTGFEEVDKVIQGNAVSSF